MMDLSMDGRIPITRNQTVKAEKLAMARSLRKEMTAQEKVLWQALRDDSLAKRHFRRQQVIAGYIVDFYCASARLAVEIDGPSHLAQQDYDAKRDRALAQIGIRTLRLTNDSVSNDLAQVLRNIAQATSPLTPLPAGEGKRRRR